MIYKRTAQNVRYSCFRRADIKFLYNSKFDFTAKSLVTNTVVITRVLCIYLQLLRKGSFQLLVEVRALCSGYSKHSKIWDTSNNCHNCPNRNDNRIIIIEKFDVTLH